jgi:hypothetical protein
VTNDAALGGPCDAYSDMIILCRCRLLQTEPIVGGKRLWAVGRERSTMVLESDLRSISSAAGVIEPPFIELPCCRRERRLGADVDES